MKKFILSLAALAFAGIAANAQGSWTPTEDIAALKDDENNVTVDDGDLAITFGDCAWQLKTTDDNATESYLAGQSVNPSSKEKNGDKYKVYGTNYPNSEKVSEKWTGLPEMGAYVVFEPACDGSIDVYSVISNGKSVYVLEVDDKNKINELPFKIGSTGYVSGSKLDVKTYGNVLFNVKNGNKYYFFCNGSKISIGSVELSKTAVQIPTAVEDIVAENASKVVKTIENGQIIIIKNGVKYNVLGQIVK